MTQLNNLRSWCQDKSGTLHPIFDELTRSRQQTHAGLWLDKYARAEKRDDKEREPRPQLIAEVAKIPVPASYQHFYTSWRETLKSYQARPQLAKVKGRLIVNLGSESVIETSIALHRTYGVPYIPGSALKGLSASYLRQKLAIQKEQEASKDDPIYKQLLTAYQILFGQQDESGYIIFFDAFYQPGSAIHHEQDLPLQPDIITVHHPKYYQGEQAPNDMQNPIPIPFLSATGNYLLALAAPDLEQHNAWITFAFDLLEQALSDWGIGAKTSSGYGRMIFTDGRPPLTKSALELRQKIIAMPPEKINSDISYRYNDWLTLTASQDRLAIAQDIISRIAQAGYEAAKEGKKWYQELKIFIDQNNQEV